jgi:prevent-host-death family protein
MKSFPSTELKQNLGDVLAAADREPIAITRHSKTRYVLMDVQTFESRFRDDPRRSYAVADMPAEHLAMLEQSVADLNRDGHG